MGKRSEADIAKIKELEEQCLKLQESKKESSKVNVKKYELKLKIKEEEVAALENRMKESAITNESSMKALADRLEQTQAQASTLMSTITTKEAAYKTKEDGLMKKQEDFYGSSLSLRRPWPSANLPSPPAASSKPSLDGILCT